MTKRTTATSPEKPDGKVLLACMKCDKNLFTPSFPAQPQLSLPTAFTLFKVSPWCPHFDSSRQSSLAHHHPTPFFSSLTRIPSFVTQYLILAFTRYLILLSHPISHSRRSRTSTSSPQDAASALGFNIICKTLVYVTFRHVALPVPVGIHPGFQSSTRTHATDAQPGSEATLGIPGILSENKELASPIFQILLRRYSHL